MSIRKNVLKLFICLVCACLVFILPFIAFVRPVRAETPTSSDITFSESGQSLTFNDWVLPCATFASLGSSSTAPTLNLGNLGLSFSITNSTGSPSTYIFGVPDFKSSWSQPNASALYYGMYLSSSDLSKFPSGSLGYMSLNGANFVGWASVAGFSTGSPTSRFSLDYGVPYLISCGFANPNSSNTFFTIFRFVLYLSSPVINTNVSYMRTRHVSNGELLPNSTALFPPSSMFPLNPADNLLSSTGMQYTLSCTEFINSNGIVVMSMYYITPVLNLYSDPNFYDLSGQVRYSSFTVDTSTSFSQAYNQGYSTGQQKGEQIGYESGFSAGQSSGYDSGYSVGYTNGVDAANQYTFFNLISSVLSAPIGAVTSLLDFSVLGMDMSSFFLSLMTVCIILKIVSVVI